MEIFTAKLLAIGLDNIHMKSRTFHKRFATRYHHNNYVVSTNDFTSRDIYHVK